MKISILSLFPEMFRGPFDHSIIKNASNKKLVNINFVNIRNFGIGKHKVVDDKPYGGGHGMILRVDVLAKAISEAKDKKLKSSEQKVILLDARGKTFTQKDALKMARLKHLILICGHYEGFDERIKKYIDGQISIGDFVVTGGEIPAMLIADAVIRLVKGVLKKDATSKESFSKLLEHSQYTRPRTHEGKSVPPVLLSGDHKKIKMWRDVNSLRLTTKLRPDLLIG